LPGGEPTAELGKIVITNVCGTFKDSAASAPLAREQAQPMQLHNIKKAALFLMVGIAAVASFYPATSKAMTITDAYRYIANIAAPQVFADAEPSPLKVNETSPLDLWLEKLVMKESQGRDRIKILDVNGKYSYGCLQFQEGTFRNFGQKYGLVAAGVNLESVIYDCNLQKAIAKNMIQDDYFLWQSWYTSVIVRDLGLPPRS
jgi:hypothetical protein